MSLLGLIATVITGGAVFRDACSDASFDAKSKQEAIRDGRLTWMDSHGNDYMVSTGEKVFYHDGKLKSVKTGRVIVDYELERTKTYNEEELRRAKENNKKYAELRYPEFNNKSFYTELSTMKRYGLYGSKSCTGYEKYEKYYYLPGKDKVIGTPANDNPIEITREEYEELGGMYLGSSGYGFTGI